MANYFVSVVGVDQTNFLDVTTANLHSGTASTAGDKIELRFDQTTTRFQVLKALEFFHRWLKAGGSGGAGANMGAP